MPKARVIKVERHGDPSVLALHDIDVPHPPSGHVRIAVRAIGLNRAEIGFRTGATATPSLPSRIGYEASGVIDAVGEDVEGFARGDRVAVLPGLNMEAYGTYAEMLNYPSDMLVKMPVGQSFVEAAASWMQYLTAYALIDPAGVQRGDNVVITAATSSVGNAAIQIANAVGAVPIALTSRRDMVETLQRRGAARAISTGEDGWEKFVQNQCSAPGPRIVLDAVGGRLAATLISLIRPGGVMVSYGALASDTLPVAIAAGVAKNLTLHFYSMRRLLAAPLLKARATSFILDGLQSGWLEPVIDRTFAFEDVVQGHQYLESRAGSGKVVLTLP